MLSQREVRCRGCVHGVVGQAVRRTRGSFRTGGRAEGCKWIRRLQLSTMYVRRMRGLFTPKMQGLGRVIFVLAAEAEVVSLVLVRNQ